MTVENIISDINNSKLAPIYFFYGDEPYYIDKLVHHCEFHILDEGAKAFNQSVVYGKEVDAKYIIDELAQYPMMSTHRVVIVKEAQEMKSLSDLLPVIERPIPHGVLVLGFKSKTVDKRTKFGKLILEKSLAFESKTLYDNQLPKWIEGYAAQIGLKVTGQIATVIAEHLGNDLKKISNELDKLKLNTGQASVTIQEVQEQIGISKDFNVFELQTALGNKDIIKARLITKYFGNNPNANPIQGTVSNLFSYFTKIWLTQQNFSKQDQELAKIVGVSPFFLKEFRTAARNFSTAKIRSIIQHLRVVDLQSKGVGNRNQESNDLLTDLIYDILH